MAVIRMYSYSYSYSYSYRNNEVYARDRED
jgi:hypothetical protein